MSRENPVILDTFDYLSKEDILFILDMAVDGKNSYYDISDAMQVRGIKSKHGKRFSTSLVSMVAVANGIRRQTRRIGNPLLFDHMVQEVADQINLEPVKNVVEVPVVAATSGKIIDKAEFVGFVIGGNLDKKLKLALLELLL